MFRANTVIVLGAGASFEVDLPVGEELLRRITGMLDIRFEINRQTHGEEALLEALKIVLPWDRFDGASTKSLNDHITSGHQLRKSAALALSIDNVIEALEDDEIELMGKLGIVTGILKAERSSKVYEDRERNGGKLSHGNLAKTWYNSFTKVLTENVKVRDLDSIFDNVQIINFNYDRCLEHYLTKSLATYYGVSEARTQTVVNRLVMHRPYGSCGKLPWQTGDAPSVEFGDCSPTSIAAVAREIRTFTEQVEEGDDVAAMRGAIAQADRIIFLGFAFHRQNIKLIASAVHDHTQFIATAMGISASDQSVIADELAKEFEFEDVMNPEQRVTLDDTTCAEFFKGYWRTITAEAPEDAPLR